MADPAGPETEAKFYTDQKPLWKMLDTLLAGTMAMRNAKYTYLPKYPQESADNYMARNDRAVLLNYFKRTVIGLVGKPFSKPLTIPKNVSPTLEELFEDIDRQGHDLDSFARNAFQIGMAKGMVHILVDMPVLDGEAIKTVEDEKKLGATPYMIAIAPEDVIGAFSEYIDGVEVLTQVRIKECIVTQDGFEEKVQHRVRVLEPGRWEIWTKGDDDKYTMTDSGKTSLSYIPMVTWYAEREGFMRTRAPLLDLAYLNVAHWQSASDQRNILTVCRFPILGASGVDPDQKLEIGPNSYFAIRDPVGKLYFVEHSGAAVNSGRVDLEDLKVEMAMMGLQLLMPQTGTQTATAKAMDGAEADCGLQSLTLSFQAVLNEAIHVLADWADDPDQHDDILLNSDFGLSVANKQDLVTLLAMRANREISHNAFMAEVMRRNILPVDFDIAGDQEEVVEEGQVTPGAADGLPPAKGTPPALTGGAPGATPPVATPTDPLAPKPTVVPGIGAKPAAMVPSEPQKQALAGGQVAGLLDIATQISDGKLSPEAAKEIIIICFPAVSPQQAQIIVDAAAKFVPTKDPPPVPPQPKGKKVKFTNENGLITGAEEVP